MPRKNDTPAKKRKAKTAARVRSESREWSGGPAFSQRLIALIAEECGGSRTAFAARLGVGTSHISKWCDHGTAPGAELLARIADKAHVSLDWLVSGNGSMRRDVTISKAALETDFAHYVERELTTRYPPDAAQNEPHVWSVNGAGALKKALVVLGEEAEEEVAALREHRKALDEVDRINSVLRATENQEPAEYSPEYHDVVKYLLANALALEAKVYSNYGRDVVLMPKRYFEET